MNTSKTQVATVIASLALLFWIDLRLADLNKDGKVSPDEMAWYIKNVVRPLK